MDNLKKTFEGWKTKLSDVASSSSEQKWKGKGKAHVLGGAPPAGVRGAAGGGV